VRKQLERKGGRRVDPKTPRAVRDVVLVPALGRALRELQLASRFCKPREFVFTTGNAAAADERQPGAPCRRRSPRPGSTVTEAAPSVPRSPHTFASLLIAEGHDVVSVSRQLGRTNPSI